MGILDERPGIPVEVDGFFRVEEHLLAWINLEDEILECAEPYHVIEFFFLLLRNVGEFA